VVNSATRRGLPGVTVSIGDPNRAITDARGVFIIYDPDPGRSHVSIDGTTATVPGASFPRLAMTVEVRETGATRMRPVVLPDLNNPDSANGVALVGPDGRATSAFAVTGARSDIALAGPVGTAITLAGSPAMGAVDLNVTPVPGWEVPMPLGRNLDAAGFVTIQPSHAAFDTSHTEADEDVEEGLDVTLSNERGLPVGTEVEVWSFDHDDEAWVNRSEETGQTGIVENGGSTTRIQVSGVITKGGWHAGVVPVNEACATTIRGRVVDQFGEVVVGAVVATYMGQFADTDSDGEFEILSVPAYRPGDLPSCTAIPVELQIRALEAGVTAHRVTLNAVVPGGVTVAGDIQIEIPQVGDCVGLVSQSGVGFPGTVVIAGPTGLDVATDANGRFFVSGLEPGSYTASFQFPGDLNPTIRAFEITTGKITTLTIEKNGGTGSRDITVIVVGNGSVSTPKPVSGATVTLVGSDNLSAAGLAGTSNDLGEVFYRDVDGPFTATAQIDVPLPFSGGRFRSAGTTVAINSPDGTIGVLIESEDNAFPELDAALSGTVSNMPLPDPSESIQIFASLRGGFVFKNVTIPDPVSGQYSLQVPSGEVIDVYLTRSESNTSSSIGNTVRSAILAVAQPAVGAGETMTVDFDLAGQSTILFENPVDLSYQNPLPEHDYFEVFLGVRDSSGLAIEFSLVEGLGVDSLPASVNLPDVSDPALAGLEVSLNAYMEGRLLSGDGLSIDDMFVECMSVLPTTPSAETISFAGPPMLSAPLAGAMLTLSEAETMTIGFQEGVSTATDGFNAVILESFTGSGQPFQRSMWLIVSPVGTTSVTLPPTALPMFIPGHDICLSVSQYREVGFAFDYEDFFSGELAQMIQDLDRGVTREYEGGTMRYFEVLDDPGRARE
jgi:hypothetical protein